MSFILRYIKIGMVAALGLFFTLVAMNNYVSPQVNWPYVHHVLSMDTIYKNANVTNRAITNPTIQQAAFYLIIGCEMLAALFCWMGSIRLLCQIRANEILFNRAKTTALFGLFLGFLLYLVGFIAIGGEWFCMWQSSSWNGQSTAGLFLNFILLVMIFLALP